MARTAKKTTTQLDTEIAESLAATARLKVISTPHEKQKEIQARFPIGTYVRGTRTAFAFEGVLGKVSGYDLGRDEDAPRVKVRFLAPIKYMGRDVKTFTFVDDAIVAVTREQLAVDKLLQRMTTLQKQYVKASEDLREAARQSDNVMRDEEHGHPVAPARKKAADKRLGITIRAEKALTNRMRDIVLKIRAIDPASVPWGWQNTR